MTIERDSAGARGMLAPELLLASQYFDRVRRQVTPEPERRLMIAVLEDGVQTYLKHVGATERRRRQLFDEADEWVESRETAWLYSFENVCAVLDLDAEYLRRGLHAWRAQARRTLRHGAVPEERPRSNHTGDRHRASGGSARS